MIEVNCETDFVTRNEDFQSFVEELKQDSINHVCDTMAEAVSERMEEKMVLEFVLRVLMKIIHNYNLENKRS